MAPYPWGWTTPNAGEFNLEDAAAISDGALVFSEQGKPHANAETHDRVRFLGAGWPDYPWLFGTDGEFTAFASVAAGQFEPIMDHLRALRDPR